MTADDIRNTRIRLGMTQEQIARTLNVSVRSISDWEHGRSKPLPIVLGALRKLQRRAAKLPTT